ncbi:hypothetical protein N566_13635 [Streptomycetaceae bacterium MP113-05]|nr:hypothetical protein N566_13635 [Streptomycetaceae bacterium MP113-05]
MPTRRGSWPSWPTCRARHPWWPTDEGRPLKGRGVMVYVLSLTAACLLGLGFVLQQHAAAQAPLRDMLSFRLLLDLVKVPRWRAGIGCMVAGQVLGAVALAQGHLSRVAPLLATNLLFAMALARRLSGQPLGLSGWTGVLLLSGGVAAFIVAGRPVGTGNEVSAWRYWGMFGSVVGLALLLVLIARHLQLFVEPPFLAAAAGLLYGLQDAMTRVCGRIVEESGPAALLTAWQPYVLVALAVTGLMLVQSAFEAGPLRMSLPSLTAAEPLAAIACGIGFLGNEVRLTPLAITGEVAGLTAVVAGVFLLGRHPAMPDGSPSGMAGNGDGGASRSAGSEGDAR